MNQFKVSKSLKNSIANVLSRRAIEYQFCDGMCHIDISGEKFHKIVVRAKMEKMQEEDHSPVPYLAKSEVYDQQVLSEVGSVYVIK